MLLLFFLTGRGCIPSDPLSFMWILQDFDASYSFKTVVHPLVLLCSCLHSFHDVFIWMTCCWLLADLKICVCAYIWSGLMNCCPWCIKLLTLFVCLDCTFTAVTYLLVWCVCSHYFNANCCVNIFCFCCIVAYQLATSLSHLSWLLSLSLFVHQHLPFMLACFQ